MFRNTLFATIATVAVVAATPALAKPGGGGGLGGGLGASVRAGGAATSDFGVSVRDTARVNGQAAASANANARAMERANTNSAVSNDLSSETMTGSRIRTKDLQSKSSSKISEQNEISTSGSVKGQTSLEVTPGMTVTDSGGATIGTVTGIRTVGNGSVKSVQVTLTDGSVIVLSGNSLTANGSVLVTNSLTTNVNSEGAAHASIDGLIHASPRSALGAAGITTLTGLTTGLTVNGTGGTAVGTVSSVLVNQSGAVVGITVDLTGGGTVTIPATTLTMNGTVVDTTFLP
jgi:hypothetical protein